MSSQRTGGSARALSSHAARPLSTLSTDVACDLSGPAAQSSATVCCHANLGSLRSILMPAMDTSSVREEVEEYAREYALLPVR